MTLSNHLAQAQQHLEAAIADQVPHVLIRSALSAVLTLRRGQMDNIGLVLVEVHLADALRCLDEYEEELALQMPE